MVPVGSPKRSVVNNTTVCHFGFEPFPGTGLARCGAIAVLEMPSQSDMERIVNTYCEQRGLVERFIPSEYGY